MIIIPDKLRRPAEVERGELRKALAEARADADHWKGECNALQRMVHEVRAEIERLKLTTGELTGAFNARPKCEKCERKDQLIEQMRKALNVLVASATPSGPLWHGSAEMQIARAALLAAERGE